MRKKRKRKVKKRRDKYILRYFLGKPQKYEEKKVNENAPI